MRVGDLQVVFQVSHRVICVRGKAQARVGNWSSILFSLLPVNAGYLVNIIKSRLVMPNWHVSRRPLVRGQ
jgi:hypothetical protein